MFISPAAIFLSFITYGAAQSPGSVYVPCGKSPIPFKCADGSGCIEKLYYCDGVVDCRDGSDEILYNATLHDGTGGIECINAKGRGNNARKLRRCLLTTNYVCDDDVHCYFGEDECDCNNTFECAGLPNTRYPRPRQCRPRREFCDNRKDCLDNSDEQEYKYGVKGYQCPVTKLGVTSSCVLPHRYRCDGTNDCDNGIDECLCNNATEFIDNRCFRCFDGELVVPLKQNCDGMFQCKDLSDECLCPNKPKLCEQICKEGQDCGKCNVGEVMCQPTSSSEPFICINRTSVCDESYDCPLGEDENSCTLTADDLFFCADKRSYIQKENYCDNKTDCQDGSDEMGCNMLFECKQHYYEFSTTAYDHARPRYTTKCDNMTSCEDMEDECNATLCGSNLPGYCAYLNGTNGFRCPASGLGLFGKEVCDGYPTCLPNKPEQSADESYCPSRFYCNDRGLSSLPIHITPLSRCDAVTDCTDESDEINCSSATHFYCESGSPTYLPINKVCDGVQNCKGGEDECQDCSDSPFSTDTFLISSYFLQVFVWVVGLFAIFGNIGVFTHNMLKLCKNKGQVNVIAYNHRILVTNLSLADLLLGIYLVGIGIANSAYKGVYCKTDIQWRASTSCVAMGSIAVISVECSVFILAIMATMRLLLVTRPVNLKLKRRYILMALFVGWIVSIVLALAPLSDSQEDYFVSDVWYRNNPYLTLANRNKMENFTTYLWSMQINNELSGGADRTLNWDNMIKTISRLNSNYTPELYFGYYSAHGVCLPRLFPDPEKDHSWGFTLFLLIMNFLIFIYIFLAYIAIYRRTSSRARKAGRMEDEMTLSLQHKITRIVITNFCCWIPICVMGFVSVGGGNVSKEAYAASAIVLLPINSACNPLLYSDLPELMWANTCGKTKCGRWFSRKVDSINKNMSRSRASSNAAGRMTEMSRIDRNNSSKITSHQSLKTDRNITVNE